MPIQRDLLTLQQRQRPTPHREPLSPGRTHHPSRGTHPFTPISFWLWVTGIFVLERFVTVSKKGLREQFLAATMWEIPFEIFLQAVHADAYFRALTRRQKAW